MTDICNKIVDYLKDKGIDVNSERFGSKNNKLFSDFSKDNFKALGPNAGLALFVTLLKKFKDRSDEIKDCYENGYFKLKVAEKKGNSSNAVRDDSGSKNAMDDHIVKSIIFYGVPGCGKSYRINKEIAKNLGIISDITDKIPDEEMDNIHSHQIRTVFHPDYTYSDFVGQIVPKLMDEESADGQNNNGKTKKTVTYEFKPGPFAVALKEAYMRKNKNADQDSNEIFLVIEEINRGNAPAIFGDIFQLLDRKEDGESEYEIDNQDLIEYINKEEKIYEGTKIRIPGNLFLYGTMNTSDQNVYTLDTAFKRRWSMKRIKNDFVNGDDFGDKPVCIFAKDGKTRGLGCEWKTFWKEINDVILEEAGEGVMGNADMRLGTHFVSEAELGDIKLFGEKVLMYLWEDVFKFNHGVVFGKDKKGKDYNSLDKLLDDFESGEKVKVFTEELNKKFYIPDETVQSP